MDASGASRLLYTDLPSIYGMVDHVYSEGVNKCFAFLQQHSAYYMILLQHFRSVEISPSTCSMIHNDEVQRHQVVASPWNSVTAPCSLGQVVDAPLPCSLLGQGPAMGSACSPSEAEQS